MVYVKETFLIITKVLHPRQLALKDEIVLKNSVKL